MGQRGPKPLSKEQLQARGSWRAKKPDKSAEKPPPKRDLPPLVDPESLWHIIRLIPDYDPYFLAVDYEFDPIAGAVAIDFFQQKLSHVKGEKTGQPFLLEDWQKAIIANLFGWKDKKTGLRRYRTAFIEVGRKNGKSPMAAGILLYLLFEDGEPGAEIYGAAGEYKQASLVFTHAWGMVRQEPYLAERAKIFKGQSKCIEIGQPGDPDYGVYRVISADAYNAHGFNTHGAVVDELHTQPNADLVDALETSFGARRQPLMIYITTSDFEREGSICNEKEDFAKQVRDAKSPINDPTFLPVIYEATLDDDWTSEAVWAKANPNLGVSVSLDYLRRQFKKALASPRLENIFKRLHLNIRTQQDIRWLPMDAWYACQAEVDPETLAGCECFGGLDLSSTTDLSAFVLGFKKAPLVYLLPFFWAPKENAEKRERRDKVPYVTWAKQGLLKLTDGNVVDYDVIRADINKLAEIFNIKEIALDRWNSTQLATQLQGDGFEMVPFGQGFASMSAPSKELEKLVISGGVAHGGHAILRWMASNVAAELDAAENIKPSKKKSTDRIDGIVAAIMAIGRMMVAPETKKSVYEERGALII
jgi:phage terminase large subunit-like protein